MRINDVHIENFKSFKGKFNLTLNEGLNILVGDNESGKSTILEAIHLVLSGMYSGRYLRNELTQYLFNNEVVAEYLAELKASGNATPPSVVIEIFLEGADLAKFEGDDNSDRRNSCGLSLKIAFDEKYQNEYEELVKTGDIKTLPLEYYDVFWSSFAREPITGRTIPIKSAFIDSTSNRYQNGSDVYISRIVKDFLDPADVVAVSQAHRKMKDTFSEDGSIQTINSKIKIATRISNKDVKLSVDLSSRNAWENSLLTYLDDVPFHYIGKGEQCIVKTRLALSHKKSQEANVILLEEPENHLSHTKLNELIKEITEHRGDKQIIISTHSSFVANKLGLGSLILLNDQKTTRLNELSAETRLFFSKLSGYDTLRLILCKKAILVEGDSDELVIQRAYMDKNSNNLPIEDGIDVISVGTSFLRFLEIAEKIDKPTVVVTDNDGDLEALQKKYHAYLGDNAKDHIKICYDSTVDEGDLKIGDSKFNYNTLEPKILKSNSLDSLNKVLNTSHESDDELHKYMKANKTKCALQIFDSDTQIEFPEYINESIA